MAEVFKIEGIVKGLEEISAYEFIMFIGALILIIGTIFTLVSKIYKFIERYRTTRNKHDEKSNVIEIHSETINKLTEDYICLREDVEIIKNKTNELHSMVAELRAEQNARELVNLKNQIRQSYSFYTQKKQWNRMEKESLEGLVKSYENCGGKNSFVHSVVEKEMYTWKIID